MRLIAIGDSLFVMGGRNDKFFLENDLWAIRPSGGGHWTQVCRTDGFECGDPPPPQRDDTAMVSVDSKLFVFGGRGFFSTQKPHNDLWAFGELSEGRIGSGLIRHNVTWVLPLFVYVAQLCSRRWR